jgi:hypothetical protein
LLPIVDTISNRLALVLSRGCDGRPELRAEQLDCDLAFMAVPAKAPDGRRQESWRRPIPIRATGNPTNSRCLALTILNSQVRPTNCLNFLAVLCLSLRSGSLSKVLFRWGKTSRPRDVAGRKRSSQTPLKGGVSSTLHPAVGHKLRVLNGRTVAADVSRLQLLPSGRAK